MTLMQMLHFIKPTGWTQVVNELIVSENMSLNSKPMFGITVSMPESW
jgi:hypothetical protein